jgi:hypothetical protein
VNKHGEKRVVNATVEINKAFAPTSKRGLKLVGYISPKGELGGSNDPPNYLNF